MENFYRKNNQSIVVAKKLDANSLLGYFSEFSDIISGVNEIVSPNAQAEKENATALAAKKDNMKWNIFIGITVLATIILLGYLIIKK